GEAGSLSSPGGPSVWPVPYAPRCGGGFDPRSYNAVTWHQHCSPRERGTPMDVPSALVPPRRGGHMKHDSTASTATQRRLGRRSFLRGAGGLGAAGGIAALTSCGSASASAEEISFWHLLSGPDGVTMGDLLAEYMATDGAGDVTQTVLGWGAPYYTKLAMASAGGRAPDVAVMHAARVPGYAPGGLLDAWDLDLLGEFGVGEEDFPELIWDKMEVDGQLLDIALDSHPFV